ncbi:MAG: hypothetical protein V1674_03265 [Candidatus Omnitrophota bacterium]
MAKWYTIALVDSTYNSREVRLTKPINLGNNVNFTIIPNWLNKLVGSKHLSFHQRQVIEDAQYMLVSECEANSLGDPDPECKRDKPRSKQEIALEKIQISNLALWLIKPSWIAFELVLHVEERNNEKVLRQAFTTQILQPHEEDKDNYLNLTDFEQAHKFNLVLNSLQRDNSLWMAIRTLWTALITMPWEVRFLLLWVVLEALFGTDTEIIYRISQRISFFVCSKKEDKPDLYKKAKESYSWRSKIVHGMKLYKLKQKESSAVLHNTEVFARKALLKILEDKELTNVFINNKKRDDYLDNLIFS